MLIFTLINSGFAELIKGHIVQELSTFAYSLVSNSNNKTDLEVTDLWACNHEAISNVLLK